jgi:drug/metabolite transporter (DMT)-like permease
MNLSTLLWLISLSLLWGPAFLFINVAVREIPPLTLAAARVTLAALILLLILKLQGRSLLGTGTSWKRFALTGLTYNALPFFLLSWGQQYIDSALAAILVGATPLFTMLLSHLARVDEESDRRNPLGILIGFGGVLLLFAPGLAGGVRLTIWGMAAALGAAASYAVAFVYTRQKLRGLPPHVGPTAQLVMASLYLVPLSLIIDKPYALPLPSPAAVIALLLLTLLSTVLAYIIYYQLMERISATNLSLVTYLNPIVATVLGVILLHESLGWTSYLGCALILLGAAGVGGSFISPECPGTGRPEELEWRQFAAASLGETVGLFDRN